jgi:hypothetical protein
MECPRGEARPSRAFLCCLLSPVVEVTVVAAGCVLFIFMAALFEV